MPGQRHLPIINKRSVSSDTPTFMRARISPCIGCKNNTPPSPTAEGDTAQRPDDKRWPCPKAFLYAHAAQGKAAGSQNANYNSPLYDPKLKYVNPVLTGAQGDQKHENGYVYAFVATYEDNVDNGWNPDFDTEKIRCRGPFMILQPERLGNSEGRIEIGDHALCMMQYYWIDGAQFEGFVIEGATWQVHTGSERKQDSNLVSTTSGATP